MKLIERTDEYVGESPELAVGLFFLYLIWFSVRTGSWFLLIPVGLLGLVLAVQLLLEVVDREGDDGSIN